VDCYVGGAEHAVLHLMYARFFTKVLHTLGMIEFDEPFTRLKNQGLIMGEDGQKMSKSRGNVINPDDVISVYGADTMRLYEMFMGPFEDAKPWSTRSIVGVRRFLERVWVLGAQVKSQKSKVKSEENNYLEINDENLRRLAHQSIKKVTDDIEVFKFNTAIAQLMTFTNEIGAQAESSEDRASCYRVLLMLLAPFAPHIAQELWEQGGSTSLLMHEAWPRYDAAFLVDDTVTVVVQVNGKKRASLVVSADVSEEQIMARAMEEETVAKHVEGKEIKKKIYIKGKLLNIVTR